MAPCNGNCEAMYMPISSSYKFNNYTSGTPVATLLNLESRLPSDYQQSWNHIMSSNEYNNLSAEQQHNYMMQNGFGEATNKDNVARCAGNSLVDDVTQKRYN